MSAEKQLDVDVIVVVAFDDKLCSRTASQSPVKESDAFQSQIRIRINHVRHLDHIAVNDTFIRQSPFRHWRLRSTDDEDHLMLSSAAAAVVTAMIGPGLTNQLPQLEVIRC